MTVDDWIRSFERDGFALITRRGRCRQLAHPWKPGRLTVVGLRRERIGPRIEQGVRCRPETEPLGGDPMRNGSDCISDGDAR